MGILQGTTPELTLNYPGVNLTGKTVEVYLKIGNRVITIGGSRLQIVASDSGSTALLRLTQKETLAMTEGTIKIQSRWIGADGTVEGTTPPVSYKVDKLMTRSEIVYTGGASS